MNKNSLEGMSVAEAALLLNTSPRTLTRRIQRGEFQQVFKLNGIRGAYVLNPEEVASMARGQE
jgi:IS30 family transposase